MFQVQISSSLDAVGPDPDPVQVDSQSLAIFWKVVGGRQVGDRFGCGGDVGQRVGKELRRWVRHVKILEDQSQAPSLVGVAFPKIRVRELCVGWEADPTEGSFGSVPGCYQLSQLRCFHGLFGYLGV